MPRPIIQRTCQNCGNLFNVPRKARHGEGKYCSVSCYHSKQIDSTLERFWSKVDKSGDCWLWTGSHTPTGYGTVSLNGVSYRAHRVAWESQNGKIPDGMILMHICDTPSCVNISHLKIGTMLENTRDMINKGRRSPKACAPGEKHGMSKLTEKQVIEIIRKFSQGETILCLTKQFGVNRTTIHNIVFCKSWKHVPRP